MFVLEQQLKKNVIEECDSAHLKSFFDGGEYLVQQVVFGPQSLSIEIPYNIHHNRTREENTPRQDHPQCDPARQSKEESPEEHNEGWEEDYGEEDSARSDW